MARQSMHILHSLFFFGTRITRSAHGLIITRRQTASPLSLSSLSPLLSSSLINNHIPDYQLQREMGAEIDVSEIEAVMNKSLTFAAENMSFQPKDLPLLSLNHVSFVCKSVQKSVDFYCKVLGFVLIKRPSSFNFEGAWLFNHGIGIHLLKTENAIERKEKINPKDNHISFQCTDMNLIIQRLEEMNIKFVTAIVREGGIMVDQLFFHDPDGYMIEICNCQNLPILPLSSCPIKKMPSPNFALSPSSTFQGGRGKMCSGEVEALMIENLAMDLMNISI